MLCMLDSLPTIHLRLVNKKRLMEYLDRIRYLIHEKSDYKTAVRYIRELLVSQERLSEQTQKLLQLKLRYCDLKLRTISADTPKSSDKLNLHSTKLLDTDLTILGNKGYTLDELEISPKVTIVVPIYNAPAALDKCLESLLRYTPNDIRIVAIDDASSDPKVSNVLDSYSTAKNLDIYNNSENRGFSGTVNRGFSLANSSDVIILNSDTVVTPGWVFNLKIKAYSHPRIATVTPLSNSAGPFSVAKSSFPRDASKIQKLLNSLNCDHHFDTLQEMPTGHGFCLYIKSKAFDEVGFFDDINFPRGYGEENDFCMRLKKKELINTLDTKSFIYHSEAESFGSEKKISMVKEGRLKVDQLHPEYGSEIRQYFSGQRYKKILANLDSFLKKNIDASPERNALFLVNVKSGGTPQTNRDLMVALKDTTSSQFVFM